MASGVRVRYSSDGALRKFVNELCRPLHAAERIDNLLAQHGFCARAHARPFCKENDVIIHNPNGVTERALSGHKKVKPTILSVNGSKLEYAGRQVHLALHKPPGFVVSWSKHEGPTVFDLLPDVFLTRKPEIQAIGRLDKGATGLLIFSTNGALNERLTSPRRAIDKEYLVALDKELHADGREVAAFASGSLTLADGETASPALLLPHPQHANVARVVLTQGRFHQIRRMFAAVGYTVTGIHRTRIGSLQLVPPRHETAVPPPLPALQDAGSTADGQGPKEPPRSASDRTEAQTAHAPHEVGLREGEWTFLDKERLMALLTPQSHGPETPLGGDPLR